MASKLLKTSECVLCASIYIYIYKEKTQEQRKKKLLLLLEKPRGRFRMEATDRRFFFVLMETDMARKVRDVCVCVFWERQSFFFFF